MPTELIIAEVIMLVMVTVCISFGRRAEKKMGSK